MQTHTHPSCVRVFNIPTLTPAHETPHLVKTPIMSHLFLFRVNNNVTTLISVYPYVQGCCLSVSVCTVGGPSVPSPRFSSHSCCYLCVLLPLDAHFQDGSAARHQTIKRMPDTRGFLHHANRLYTLTPLFHIAMLLMHPCSYSRSIWCMCQAWGGGLTDYIKLQCGKRAQRCQSGPCDGRSVEQ